MRSSPETLFAGGSGTGIYPWQIVTAEQLYLTRFYEYWMPDTDADINDGYPYLEYRPVNNDDPSVPVAQELLCIHPNPFNPCTTISFDLAKAAKVSVQIHNVKGQLVCTIIKAELRSGKSSNVWDGRDALENPLLSGLYFCVLKADGKSTVKKMTLLK